MKKIAKVAVLVLLPILGGLGWFERARVQAWYYVRQLSKADNSDRDLWIERVAALGQCALPDLSRCLGQDKESPCESVLSVLEKLAGKWGAEDPRMQAVAEQLADRYGEFSWPGRRTVLQLQSHLLEEHQNPSGTFLSLSRRLAHAGLADDRAEVRLAAVRLATHPGLELFPHMVALLADPIAEVRAAALLAVGGVQRADAAGTEDFLIPSDDLLPCLHDADADVRRLCETTLRGRGLTEGQVELGRLITHEQPQVRLQVLACLRRHRDLDWRVWIRRLSQDRTPAVRAAAVRAATDHKSNDFLDELQHIAQNDPTPTVRQIAQHYLNSGDTHNGHPNRPR